MNVPAIGVAELATRRDEGAPLIDVRQPDEWQEFRVPGAKLIPLPQIPSRTREMPRDATVYVICRTGSRSAKAVEFLRARGIDAVNVAGGSLAWAEAGYELERGPATS